MSERTTMEQVLLDAGEMTIHRHFDKLRAIWAVLRGQSLLYNVEIYACDATIRSHLPLHAHGTVVLDIPKLKVQFDRPRESREYHAEYDGSLDCSEPEGKR